MYYGIRVDEGKERVGDLGTCERCGRQGTYMDNKFDSEFNRPGVLVCICEICLELALMKI